ncbi:MAG: hypothetical protein LH478_03345 [Chitinophagaceae bacterium]|nr:hypothetical protein [Chitinophagaceae bacterium]
MKRFLNELKFRNRTLYFFGWCNLITVIVCFILVQVDDTTMMGINAWIKPIKFLISVAIYSWTMGWLLYYLNEPQKVKRFNLMVLIVFVFENGYILFQAARGQKSHFNFSSPITITLYSLMGLAITVLVLWTGYFAILFFKRKVPGLSKSYLWGIRLGMLTFVIFALSAHIMASSTGHTVGAPDGSPGLPFLNWSIKYGDLRAVHFFGMHALQLLPILGFYSNNSKLTVGLFIIYFLLCTLTLFIALQGKPLFAFL